MDNSTLKALIDEYGERICAFFIDNEHKILFNYPGTPKISEVELVTIGGVDFYKIPYTILFIIWLKKSFQFFSCRIH